jgi:hypothetical protein
MALPFLTLLLISCTQSTPGPASSPPAPTAAPVVQATYVGASACKACHPAEFAAQQASRHARSLAPFTTAALGALAPPPGPAGDDAPLKVVKGDRGLEIVLTEINEALPIRYAVGSGKSGMTFVADMPNDELLELRPSWFPGTKKWYLTPGHEKRPKGDLGMMYTAPEAKQCIVCHDTARVEGQKLGIACERCHGPGSAHVATMKQNPRGPLQLSAFTKASPAGVNAVCGDCHRSRETVASDDPEIHQTGRFQMIGMTQSACYVKSGNKLTCVTCHSPHHDAETREPEQVKACLTCHSPQATTTETTHKAALCKVNPTSGCISCHMPKHRAFSKASLPVKMADHLIKVWK